MGTRFGGQRGASRIGLITAGSVASGVHAGLAPEHLHEWLPLGLAFVIAAVVAGVLVIAVAFRPDEVWRVRALATLLAALVLAYLLTRLTALPPLDPERESFDTAGLLTIAAELAGIAATATLAAPPIRSQLAPKQGGTR